MDRPISISGNKAFISAILFKFELLCGVGYSPTQCINIKSLEFFVVACVGAPSGDGWGGPIWMDVISIEEHIQQFKCFGSNVSSVSLTHVGLNIVWRCHTPTCD